MDWLWQISFLHYTSKLHICLAPCHFRLRKDKFNWFYDNHHIANVSTTSIRSIFPKYSHSTPGTTMQRSCSKFIFVILFQVILAPAILQVFCTLSNLWPRSNFWINCGFSVFLLEAVRIHMNELVFLSQESFPIKFRSILQFHPVTTHFAKKDVISGWVLSIFLIFHSATNHGLI